MNLFRVTRVNVGGYVAVALVIFIGFLFSWHTLTSIYQDIGRHLTLGELIWRTHEVPRTNLFSYTNPNHPFVNHHWLGEVMLYLADRAVGLSGLIALKAGLIALAFVLSLAACLRRHLLLPAALTGLVAAFIILERTDVRPEVLGFVFLGWFLFVLYRHPGGRLVWTLPFVQLFWVNSHISFFMGPFVFVAWALGGVIRDGPAAFRSVRLWLLGGVIAVATLLNPWGLSGALQPFTILSDYGYSIVENKSYFFLRAYHYQALTSIALYLGFVLTAASFVLNRSRLRHNVMGLLLAAGTAVFALVMIRNYPLFALVMVPVILRNLDEAGLRWSRRGGWLVSALLALIVASTVQGQVFRRVSGGMEFGLHVPEGHQHAVDFFRENGIRGPIYNNFDIGSYLIWKLPEEPVFIDGRPEAYPSEFLQETYIRSQERDDVWERMVTEYGLNAIVWNTRDITPWSRAFVARIQTDEDWVPVYFDGQIAILVRDLPRNAELIARLRQDQ